MATIEQIENFRFIRGKNIMSVCVCGKRQAWTDYYGGPACKNCIEFFISSIRERQEYVCNNMDGLCNTDVNPDGFGCKYCHLEMLYKRAELKPKMYGRYENRWYTKDVIPHLRRTVVTARDVTFSDINYEANIMRDFASYYSRGLHLTRNEEFEAIFCRVTVMQIMVESLHCHDVLKSNCRFIDPYKMKTLLFQNHLIEVLEITRRFLEIVEVDIEVDYPSLEQIDNYIFMGIRP
ncbi:uncharacterized protein LOC111613485 isoform X2 [Centruroides sculpturatus]|uniref:uncharacterized protein LOC111613485 isoform X2 n=1 Tax=Centruroides sculpturatus TaxID=218467 RepID=UPI000C6CB077|nr:uncharacterized protein LOC111613485 isoform X2 [Centruroides sculpturatus]